MVDADDDDVVIAAVVIEGHRFGIEHGVAGTGVVIARLSNGADGDDVLAAFLEADVRREMTGRIANGIMQLISGDDTDAVTYGDWQPVPQLPSMQPQRFTLIDINHDGGGIQAIRTLNAMIEDEHDPGSGETAQAAE